MAKRDRPGGKGGKLNSGGNEGGALTHGPDGKVKTKPGPSSLTARLKEAVSTGGNADAIVTAVIDVAKDPEKYGTQWVSATKIVFDRLDGPVVPLLDHEEDAEAIADVAIAEAAVLASMAASLGYKLVKEEDEPLVP